MAQHRVLEAKMGEGRAGDSSGCLKSAFGVDVW